MKTSEPTFIEELMGGSQGIEQIDVGVRYQRLGYPESNEDDVILTKHWVLVFTHPSNKVSLTMELTTANDSDASIYILVNKHEGPYEAFPLGSFRGQWSDLDKVLIAHPQRGSRYSTCFNNCQHFVATFLIFLKAFAESTPGRDLEVKEFSRYEAICKVLPDISMPTMWNQANQFLDRLCLMVGLFPLIRSMRDIWMQKTTFENPLVNGFPTRDLSPLTEKELFPPSDNQDASSSRSGRGSIFSSNSIPSRSSRSSNSSLSCSN